MSCTFSIETKKSLANRIQKINDKKSLTTIKKIITDNNPELDEMKNSNGIFLKFNNLSNVTYKKIKTFLDSYEKQKKKNEIRNKLRESELLSEEINFITETSDNNTNNLRKYKLTNEETNLINRIKYEKTLEENAKDIIESSEDYSSANIFVHTTKKTQKNLKNKIEK